MFEGDARRSPGSADAACTTTSWSTEQGGPAPGDPLSAVALRQRILSEAAVRLLDPGVRRWSWCCPQNWRPDSTLGFFGGLDVDWLASPASATSPHGRGVAVDPETLVYPAARHAVSSTRPTSPRRRRWPRPARRSQNVLTRNDTVASDRRRRGADHAVLRQPCRPDRRPRRRRPVPRAGSPDQLASIEVDAPAR